jgi:hypothetical protein
VAKHLSVDGVLQARVAPLRVRVAGDDHGSQFEEDFLRQCYDLFFVDFDHFGDLLENHNVLKTFCALQHRQLDTWQYRFLMTLFLLSVRLLGGGLVDKWIMN